MMSKSIRFSVSMIFLRMSSSVAAKAENTLKAERFISLERFSSLLVGALTLLLLLVGGENRGDLKLRPCKVIADDELPIRKRSPERAMFKLSEAGSHHKKEATVGIKWLEIAATLWSSGLVSINKAKVSAAKIRVSGA